jgi:hypothetical protein
MVATFNHSSLTTWMDEALTEDSKQSGLQRIGFSNLARVRGQGYEQDSAVVCLATKRRI